MLPSAWGNISNKDLCCKEFSLLDTCVSRLKKIREILENNQIYFRDLIHLHSMHFLKIEYKRWFKSPLSRFLMLGLICYRLTYWVFLHSEPFLFNFSFQVPKCTQTTLLILLWQFWSAGNMYLYNVLWEIWTITWTITWTII